MKFLKWIYQLWIRFGLILGWITTRIVLTVLFYFILTSMSLIAKLVGKQFLDLKPSKTNKTYWNYRKPKAMENLSYEKQF